jgi:hypothetical protein
MAHRQPDKLTRLFAAQAAILAAEMGSRTQREAAALRDSLLARLTSEERGDLESVCLALAAMCKEKAA